MLPDQNILEEAAIELGVDPSFIEKDWYAVQVLKAVSVFEYNSYEVVFSGGTSLSKGYNLINRFSEDLDFYIRFLDGEEAPRPVRKDFRKAILQAIGRVDNIRIIEESILIRNDRRFFSSQIQYTQIFNPNDALRPELKVEFTFQNPKLDPLNQPLNTIIGNLSNNSPITSMPCIRPEETGSDKFSALTWRVLARDRNTEEDDPAIIRHAHDLHALLNICLNDKEGFSSRVNTSFNLDKRRGKEKLQSFINAHKAAEAALQIMLSDTLYKEEYTSFVESMSYGKLENRITFDMAMTAFEELSKKIQEPF